MDTPYEFVKELWENCREGYDEKLDVETAANDLQRFRDEDWAVPEDLTAEDFAQWWNELVAWQEAEDFDLADE